MRLLSHFLFITATIFSLVSCQQQEVVEETQLTVTAGNVVIGKDDRAQTTAGNLTNPALGLDNGRNRRIRVGQLITKIPTDDSDQMITATCSAALINRKFIVTAAHCAFKEGTNETHRNTYFVPGIRKKNQFEFGRFPVVKVYLPAGYDNLNSDPSNDIAVMELGSDTDGEDAGARVGSYGFWGKKEFPEGETLTIGYPGDKEFSTQYFEKGCYVENDYLSTNMLNLDCDVFKGQSGSPILVYSTEYKNFYIHGVITSESPSLGVNYGSFISVERGRIIKSILNGTFLGSSGFTESWIKKDIAHDKVVRALVKNNCTGGDAYLGYNIKMMNNEWITRGFYKVGPGETFELPESPNGVFYITAQSKDTGRSIISGQLTKYVPGSGSYSFARFKTNKFGDTQVNLPCAR